MLVPCVCCVGSGLCEELVTSGGVLPTWTVAPQKMQLNFKRLMHIEVLVLQLKNIRAMNCQESKMKN
jgi:hypothetical protein